MDRQCGWVRPKYALIVTLYHFKQVLTDYLANPGVELKNTQWIIERLAAAVLDRLIKNSEILNISGDSCRVNHRNTIL